MTAHLQPGDKIHIAFPIMILASWDQNDVLAQVHKLGAELTTIYGQMGVEVVGFSSSPTLDRPVVVSVVRELKRQLRSAEKLNLGEDPPLPWQEATEPAPAPAFHPHHPD